MTKLGENLKNLLKNANLSENELARRTGIPQQMINRILSGKNTNPKIATLMPLANYFLISISQLIGDDTLPEKIRVNTSHLGWREIPFVEWKLIHPTTLDKTIQQSKNYVLADLSTNSNCFSTKLIDDSMEPRFPNATLLLFDRSQKIKNNSFGVFYCELNHEVIFRYIIKKQNQFFIKCLNPERHCHTLTTLTQNTIYLGLLLQSRTDF